MARITLMLLALWPVQAMAMNWEGHDDWMLDLDPAAVLMDAGGKARPLPSQDCPVTSEAAAKNPYEQIPLPRHKCKPSPQNAEPRR